MNDTITRIPFITRTPITSDLLKQDSINFGSNQSNMEQLIGEIANMSYDDPRFWIDDAFARRFASIDRKSVV